MRFDEEIAAIFSEYQLGLFLIRRSVVINLYTLKNLKSFSFERTLERE